MNTSLLNKLAAEFTGTFVLVLAGTGAVVANEVSGGAVSHVGIALAFGLAILTMAYAVGDVSGGHFNPAVTLGLWLARKFPGRSVGAYVGAQTAGALVASATLWCLFGNVASLGATTPAGPLAQSFAIEALATAALMFVVLNVTSGAKETGAFGGIAVGAVITLGVMFAGPVSGGSMNPARSLAPALFSGALAPLWVYLLAPCVGAAAAVGMWRATRGSFSASEAPADTLPLRPATERRAA